MNGRPHQSPDCRCGACARYDREQETQYPYGGWSDKIDEANLWAYAASAYAAERAAWQALINMYDAVFRDDSRDDS